MRRNGSPRMQPDRTDRELGKKMRYSIAMMYAVLIVFLSACGGTIENQGSVDGEMRSGAGVDVNVTISETEPSVLMGGLPAQPPLTTICVTGNGSCELLEPIPIGSPCYCL